MTGKLEWFGGNVHGLDIYNKLVVLAHIWDDLVDKDKEVTDEDINFAFEIALLQLPMNPLYARLHGQLLPMWMPIINAYRVANLMEKSGDAKNLEISHTLRYAVGHMIAFIVEACVGRNEAVRIMPEVWRQIVAEDFTDYLKEHTHG